MSNYIVQLDPETYATDSDAISVIQSAGAQVVKNFSFGGFFEVSGDHAQLQNLQGLIKIEEIGLGNKARLSVINTDHLDFAVDPAGNTQFDPKFTGVGAHVFLLDTGIQETHSEFSQATINNLHSRFLDDQSVPVFSDSVGHGTSMASLIVGKNLGMSPDATLHNVKLFQDAQGEASLADIMEAFDEVYQYFINNASSQSAVMCLPWTTDYSDVLNSAVESLMVSGLIVVCAAGNDGDDVGTRSPASVPTAITVGSFNRDLEVTAFMNTNWGDGNQQSSFVNYGASVDIFALGVDVSIADFQTADGYSQGSGTSISTAIVAGGFAQYISGYSQKTSAELRESVLAEGHLVGANNLVFDSQDANVDYTHVYPAMITVENSGQTQLSTKLSGRIMNVKAGDSETVNMNFNPDATQIEALEFAPLPPWITLDVDSGNLSADASGLTNEQIPGLYVFALRGTVNGDVFVEEYSVGLYQDNPGELDPEVSEDMPVFYYDADADKYDEVVSYALSKDIF